MSKVFGILLVGFFCWLTLSNAAFADKIQGQFLCEKVFPDGSKMREIAQIDGSQMTMKDFDYDITTDWKEVYVTSNLEKGYTVFAMTRNSAQHLVILAPTSDKNQLMITSFDTEKYYKKAQISYGMCRKF